MCVLTHFSWGLCNPLDYSPQAPLSVGIPRQEYWSELPCPPPGDLPDPRVEAGSPALQADSLLSHQGRPMEGRIIVFIGNWTVDLSLMDY